MAQKQPIKETIEELDAPTTPPAKKKKWSWRDPQLNLGTFLTVALLAASIIVTVGHTLYVTSAEYKLDITRPGFRGIQKDDLVEVDRNQSYDSTSPIDRKALQDELRSITSRQEDLGRYGDFSGEELKQLQESLFSGPKILTQ